MQGGFRITTRRQRRGAGDTFVPMINIVFLLLIFFLLSATIAPPDPLELTLPEIDGAEVEMSGAPGVLHVSASGELIYGELRGDAALEAVAAQQDGSPVALRADAEFDGAAFATLLARLSALGVNEIELAVRQP